MGSTCGCNNQAGPDTQTALVQENNGDIPLKGSLLDWDLDKYNELPRLDQIRIKNSVNKIIHTFRNRNKVETGTLNTSIIKKMLEAEPVDFNGEKDSEGLKEGFGIQKWQDGSKFKGMFVKGKASGFGLCEQAEGDLFMGEFEENKTNGFGEYKHQNGTISIGYWKDDLQTGIGYETWADSSEFMGEYNKGKKDGVGTYIWQDKTTYKGEWKGNNINGCGIYLFADGRSYSGEWKNNQMDGFGEFTWPDGKKYTGFYKNDKKHGFGLYFWPNQKVYIGFFENGKQQGLAKFAKGKTVKYGIWIDGKKEKFLEENEFLETLEKDHPQYKQFFEWDLNTLSNFFSIEQE